MPTACSANSMNQFRNRLTSDTVTGFFGLQLTNTDSTDGPNQHPEMRSSHNTPFNSRQSTSSMESFFFFLLNCFPIILTLTYIVRGMVELNERKAI